MKDNPHFRDLETKLRRAIKGAKNPYWKMQLEEWLNLLYRGIELDEHQIDLALSGAIRGAEFDGDEVGRWNDEDDEDKDEKSS